MPTINEDTFNHRTSNKKLNKEPKPQEVELMNWSTKTIKSSPKDIMKAQLWLIAGATLMNALVTAAVWQNLPKYNTGLLIAYIFSYALTGYFILILRQKTVFNYRLTETHGEVEHYRYYPRYAGTIFKGFASFTVLFFVGASLYTGSLSFMIGPATMALGASRFLFGWKNEITNLRSSPWREYNFVTIDRKRLMVVTHRSNQSVGFETRFTEDTELEKYLNNLKKLLPKSAIYSEKNWPG
ncbi:permease [Pseudomonas sp. NPDC087598]|uniref:permease n=1 Tax=Pseudomonas sp. NPDC087598 TaxID=3364440 RepID=UPI0038018036